MPRVNGVYYASEQDAYNAQQLEIQQLQAMQALANKQRAAAIAAGATDDAADGFASVQGTCSVLAYQGVRFASPVGTFTRHDQSAFVSHVGWLYFAPRMVPVAVAARAALIRRLIDADEGTDPRPPRRR